MMRRLAAAFVFGAYALLLWGCSSASVRDRTILPYDDEIADVSLPMPLPAPRNGPDIKDGTVTAYNRPAQEKLTPAGTRKMVSDNRLRTDVLAAIVDDPAVDPFQFRYVVEDGNVEIRGQGSDRQKRRVTETVSRVRGVREVQSPVNLPEGADPKWAAPVTDEEIERAIVDAIARDPNADISHVEIYVQNGEVALLGSTPNMRTRQAIEKNAHAMQGVKSVRNQIEVKPKYIREDDRLVRDVRTALSFEPLLNSTRIQVSADRGVVTLKGQVTSPWKKERATELGSEVFGVVSIENDLTIAKLPASNSDAVLN
ncbi:MAG: BON domain-containing protein [Bdellovibrionia bacterium]